MQLPTKTAGTALVLLAGALALSVPVGCFALGEGLEPPLQQFYYPTAVLASPGGRALYVVNSDFDIQYTGGTVQALDLEGLRTCLGTLRDDLAKGTAAEAACPAVGLSANTNPVLVPGPCSPLAVDVALACTRPDAPDEAQPLVRASHVIGAFASSATLVRNPDPAGTETRLFVAVRGDPSITYFDTTDDARAPDADPFRLECDADALDSEALGGRCGPIHRIGDSPTDSSRSIVLQVEPVGIAANDDGRSVAVVHDTSSSASLLINKWGVAPTLEHNLAGLPDGPGELTAIPTPGLVAAAAAAGEPLDYRPGFLVTYRAARAVDILRAYDDSQSTLGRHFLQRVASFPVLTNSDGADSRGIAVDDSARRACEAGCGGEVACLKGCVGVPIGVYVANRAPASLLVGKLETTLVEENGKITSAADRLSMTDMVPLTAGASRVTVGDVLDADGQRSPRVFAVSFDSRYLVVFDPHLRRVEASMRTGRGPHALAVDVVPDAGGVRGHAFLYVAHFTDSYVGVVDLDTRNTRTYGSMFATVGQPTPPKESN